MICKIWLSLFLVWSASIKMNAQNARNYTTRSNPKMQSALLKSREFKQFRSKLLNENDDEVLKLAPQLIKDFPKDSLGISNIYFVEGNVHYKRKNFTKALASYEKARELMTNHEIRFHFQNAVDRTKYRIEQQALDEEKESNSKKKEPIDLLKAIDSLKPENNKPFNIIENVPVYPGCENESSNDLIKSCMSQKINALIIDNFDVNFASYLDIIGKQRTDVTYTIDSEGLVSNIIAKGMQPNLELEAIRVIGLIPKMRPGMQRDKPVSVIFQLPIVFKVE